MWTPRGRLPGCSKKIIEIPCKKARREERRAFLRCGEGTSLPSARQVHLVQIPICRKGPKVSKGRPESPLVAPAGAKPSAPANRYDPILCQQQDGRAALLRRARVLCLSPQGRIVRGFLREVMVSRTQWQPLQWLQSPPQAQAPLPSRLSFIIFHTMAPTTITSMPPMIQVAIAMLLSGRGDYAPTLIRWVR